MALLDIMRYDFLIWNEKISAYIHCMRMGIVFNWFRTTLGCWKLLRRITKRVNKAKRELAYYFYTLHACLGAKHSIVAITNLVRGLIAGMLSM